MSNGSGFKKIQSTPSELRASDEATKFNKQRREAIKIKQKAKRIANKKKKKGYKPGKYPDPSYLKGRPYSEFLKSPYWLLVRGTVLKRDKYMCVICQSTKTLQVHHDTYKNHFNEHNHLGDLMTLCRKCHKEHHYAQK